MPDSDKHNQFPSTAFNQVGHPDADPGTVGFVPCRLNNHSYYQQGKGAHDLGQREHITTIQGYCEHKVLGGCERCKNA